MLDKILDYVGKVALLVVFIGLTVGTIYGLGLIVVSLLKAMNF